MLDIRDLLVRLALGKVNDATFSTTTTAITATTPTSSSSPADKAQERIIQADARRCLLIAFSIFYATREKQAKFLHELLASLQHEEALQKQPGEHSPTELLLSAVLEKLSQEFGISDLLFAPLADEGSFTNRQRNTQQAKAPPLKANTSTEGTHMDAQEGVNQPETRDPITRESSEKLVREMVSLATDLLSKEIEAAKSRKTSIEDEVKSLLFEAEPAATIGPTVAEQASIVHNVMLAVQRDLFSMIEFAEIQTASTFTTGSDVELDNDENLGGMHFHDADELIFNTLANWINGRIVQAFIVCSGGPAWRLIRAWRL